jgi:hypothetical protein
MIINKIKKNINTNKNSKQIKSSQKHKDYNWRKEMGG